jgi:hypothetical protein
MASASRPSLALILLALLLTACGGGGSGSDGADVGVAPPPVASASAGGIWRGTLTTSESGPRSIEGVITEDGRLWLRDGTEMMYFGTLSVSGRQASGKIRGIRLTGGGLGHGDIYVSVEERVSLSGTLTSQGAQNGSSNSGKLELRFQLLYNQPSSYATVAGNYVPLKDPSASIWAVDSLGRVFTQSTFAGKTSTGNGQLGVIDPRFNVYDYSMRKVSDSNQGEVLWSGLAVLDDSAQPRTLTVYCVWLTRVYGGNEVPFVDFFTLNGV